MSTTNMSDQNVHHDVSSSSSSSLLSSSAAHHQHHHDNKNLHSKHQNVMVVQPRQHQQHRMISMEQMMEQEMKDIHTILIAMCVVTISILLCMMYSMHQPPSPVENRSKKSTTDSHDNHNHQNQTYHSRNGSPIPLYRSSSSKHTSTTAKQNDYIVISPSWIDRNGRISPLSMDTIQNRLEACHNNGHHNIEESHHSKTHDIVATMGTLERSTECQPESSHPTTQPPQHPPLSPCSEWWKNRRVSRLHHKKNPHSHRHSVPGSTNNNNNNTGPERDLRFITPIQDHSVSHSHTPHRQVPSSFPQTRTTALTTAATKSHPIYDDHNDKELPVVALSDRNHHHPYPESSFVSPLQTNVPRPERLFTDSTTSQMSITKDRTHQPPAVVTPMTTTTTKTKADNGCVNEPALVNDDDHPDNCSFIDDYW